MSEFSHIERTTSDTEEPLQEYAFTERPEIELKYGKASWELTQSPIDILQNHLDANTTTYEKKLLKLVGITSYDPESADQQKIISILSSLSKTSDEIQQKDLIESLKEVNYLSILKTSEFLAELKKIEYSLPRLQLKVSNGSKLNWVAIEKVESLDAEWKVIGVRVHDIGSGFDHNLLGMMGASTKGNSASKRGGLGEGLKMSIAHLLREGSKIRLLSKTPDGIWIAEAKVEDNQVVFKGNNKPPSSKELASGSITEIEFPINKAQEKANTTLLEVFDPRKGEGLGKYILEYREQVDPSIIDSTTELSSQGVPDGRVYVRGLLIREDSPTLLSYNLKNKWSISGRDRKTVNSQDLRESVRKVLTETYDKKIIAKVLNAILESKPCLELDTLMQGINLNAQQKEVWKDLIENIFDFKLGEKLFSSDLDSSNKERLAEEKGYSLIKIQSKYQNIINFFEKLYPEKIISLAQLNIDYVIPIENKVEIREFKIEVQPKFEPLSTEQEQFVQYVKARFKLMILSNAVEDIERGVFRHLGSSKLASLEFKCMPKELNVASNFKYEPLSNQLLINPDMPLTKENEISLYLELLKINCNRNVFDNYTQEILTRLASRPTIYELPIRDLSGTFNDNLAYTGREEIITYSPEEKGKDQLLIMAYELVTTLNRAGVSRGEVETNLEYLREICDEGIPSYTLIRNLTERYYYWDNQIYQLDTASLTISIINFEEVVTQDGESFSSPRPTTIENLSKLLSFTYTPKLSHEKEGDDDKESTKDRQVVLPDLEQLTFDTDIIMFPRKRTISLRSGMLGSYIQGDRKLPTSVPQSEVLLDANDVEHTIGYRTNSFLPLEIKSSESVVISFENDAGQYSLSLKRENNKLLGQQTVNGSIKEVSYKNGELIHLGHLSITIYNSILWIQCIRENCSLSIEHKEYTEDEAAISETNENSSFLPTSVSLDYGTQVWNDPKRVLIDSMQNHIDAKKTVTPEIEFTLIGPENELIHVNKKELLELSSEWKIVEFSITDEGEGYSTPYLTVLGKTTKGDQDIGKFGEGLKMLTASCVRQGINIELSSKNWKATPRAFTQTVKDYETESTRSFEMLGYDLEWSNKTRKGSCSHLSLIPLGKNQEKLDSSQVSQIEQVLNSQDALLKVWELWIEVLDPRLSSDPTFSGIQRVVLEEKSVHTNGPVSVYPDLPGRVYEKSLLISENPVLPMLFGYNINATIVNTRERNGYDERLFEMQLREYFSELTDKKIMKKILEALIDNPTIEYYEYKFLSGNTELWRETYYEVFGEDAVLSLKPLLSQMLRNRRESQLFMIDPDPLVSLLEATRNEVHLENRNLVTLPEVATVFFDSKVYTSREYTKKLNESDLIISQELRMSLFSSIQSINEEVIRCIERIEADKELSKVIYTLVSKQVLQDRKLAMSNMKPENINLKSRSYPARGVIKLNNNGVIDIALNEGLLNSEQDLIEVYVHELSHYITGELDYTDGFNRFLMLLAIFGNVNN